MATDGAGGGRLPAHELALAVEGASLPQRLQLLLRRVPTAQTEAVFDLDRLSLSLGRRLPDQARTLTYWQRGEIGRALRAAGFGVRVEFERVIFVRR